MPTLLNWWRAVFVAAALSGGGQIAHADANFQGKTVTIFIGYGVGGSYDLYAQLFAHHLGRFLPGQSAGSSGKGSTGYMIPALAAPLLGLKIKHVGGYNSSREMILAMEKGEIDASLYCDVSGYWMPAFAGMTSRELRGGDVRETEPGRSAPCRA